MFTKIKLKNFRSFDNIEFDLTFKSNIPKNLAVVYGENGVGKSNLMSAFVLLSELLTTMDVRDAYEELVNQKAIFNDENIEKIMRQSLMSGLRDMQAIINDCRMVGNDESIIVEYEFFIGGNIGRYHIELGKTEILHERLEYLLTKRRGVYFDCRNGNITINNNIVTDKDLFIDIKAAAKRFWGKHSILAIVLHELEDKSISFGWDNISGNFGDVLGEFIKLSCNLGLGNRHWDKLKAPIEVIEDASYGRISKNKENQLDIAEKVFSQFFTSINSDIKRVYYKRIYNDKHIEYELYFEKLIAGAYRNIPFTKESTGNHQLLRVLCYMLCACLEGTVVIDEADSGIHDVLFQKLILEIQSSINGQLIITSHNTMLMEAEFARDSVYIISEDETGHKSVRCVNDYDKRTYLNSNIRNKYLNNAYGGLPTVKPVDFAFLLKQLSNMLEN